MRIIGIDPGNFIIPGTLFVHQQGRELPTVSVSYAILAEAGLSFLGLGVEASTPTWGLILAEARSFISRAWWLGVFPGLAIMLTVLSINFLGDSLRDLLDVRETKDLG